MGCAQSAAITPTDGGAVSVRKLPLGAAAVERLSVPQAGKYWFGYKLRNRTDEPVHVARLGTSCDCVKINLDQRTIAPNDTVQGWGVVDFTDEPHFVGALELSGHGYSDTRQELFQLDIPVAVKRRAATQSHGRSGSHSDG